MENENEQMEMDNEQELLNRKKIVTEQLNNNNEQELIKRLARVQSNMTVLAILMFIHVVLFTVVVVRFH